MTDHITDTIKPMLIEGENDKAWWMEGTSGAFTVQSANGVMRRTELVVQYLGVWDSFQIEFFSNVEHGRVVLLQRII